MYYLYLMLLYLGEYAGTKLDVESIKRSIQSYNNLCPESSCLINITSDNNYTFPLPDCLYCRCSVDCIQYGDCCPNVLLLRPERSCVTPTILSPRQVDAKSRFEYVYDMVNDCPLNISDEISSQCTKERKIVELMTTPPVTSLNTFLTYKNVYCSQCHAESGNLETWQLDTFCKRRTDFNFLSSNKEIEQHAIRNNCSITHIYSNFAERCIPHPEVAIDRCNQTGTQINKNTAIEDACLYINQRYGIYRNVFCYMCNPIDGNLDETSTCLLDNQSENAILCHTSPRSDLTYPYRNQYCYFCNINESTEIVSDIHYDMNITGTGFIAYIFTSYCKQNYKLGTLDVNNNFEIVNEIEDPLPLSNNSDILTTKPVFSRPWKYYVKCQHMEIFSKLYTVQQLQTHALASGCIFDKYDPGTSFPLKCFKKTHLIRQCNVKGYLYYVEPIFEMGCLFLENENLIGYNGYYNVFCYMCNAFEPLYPICQDEYLRKVFNLHKNKCYTSEYGSAIQTIWCQICSQPKGGGIGYRPLFTLSSYKDYLTPLKVNDCYEDQLYDYRLNLCRDLVCSPGKFLKNNTCMPFLETTDHLKYIFTSGITISLNILPNGNEKYNLNDIYEGLKDYFRNKFNNDYMIFEIAYLISDSSCNSSLNFSGIFYLQLHFLAPVQRQHTEETFLSILSSSYDIISGSYIFRFFKNDLAYYAPIMANNLAFSDRCIFAKGELFGERIYVPSHVNDLLLCNQVELKAHEYSQMDKQQIKVHFNNYILGPNDYLFVRTDKVRICADKYEQIMSFNEQKHIDSTMYVLSSICSGVSVLCLSITFITYALFPVLRTIPGHNNMVLALALMINEILIHIRVYDFNGENVCKIFGVLSHYFILTVFMSFNVCTFHLYRVFTCSLSQFSTGQNIRTKYILYTFAVPAGIVACNIIVTYLTEKSIGYGGDSCFIILKTAAIVTLHCPIGVILLGNAFMFIMAIRQIRNSPHVSSENSTREKRKDIVIFMKLFTITGCTWIFQFVDAFFPASIFSVLISFCNLLSGVYIFVSYIFNRRVLLLYKQKCLKQQHENEGVDGSKSIGSGTTLHRLSSISSVKH